MKFCFVCGKKTEGLIEGYCKDCYNKEFNLIGVPKKINITVCTKCGSIKEKNTWKKIELDEFVRKKIKILGKNVDIDIEENNVLKIHVKGFLKDSKKIKEEHYEIPIKRNKVVCIYCIRKNSDYTEAIIQLRGDVEKNTLDMIDDLVTKEIVDGKQVFYRIKRVTGGYDFFMGDRHTTNKIVDFLKRRFDARIKKSYKLVTHKKGKDIYKDTILVRI